MSSRSLRLRIYDILAAVQSIEQRLQGISFQQFNENEILAKSILYDFVVMGEAAANIPITFRETYPLVPWRYISDMRNRVAHEYFRVSLEIVWDTIQEDFPTLRQQLQEILDHLHE